MSLEVVFLEPPLLSGDFELTVRRHGRVIERWREPNLIVDLARDGLARLIAGQGAAKAITQIGFGVGATPPAPGNTALTGAFKKPVGAVTFPATGKARFAWNLATTEANGMEIREFGLLCSDGSLFARKVRGVIAKEDDLSIDGSWTIAF